MAFAKTEEVTIKQENRQGSVVEIVTLKYTKGFGRLAISVEQKESGEYSHQATATLDKDGVRNLIEKLVEAEKEM